MKNKNTDKIKEWELLSIRLRPEDYKAFDKYCHEQYSSKAKIGAKLILDFMKAQTEATVSKKKKA